MLKTFCDICNCAVKSDICTLQGIAITEHYCERCRPFAEEFRQKRVLETNDALGIVEKRLNSFRDKFMRDVVVPQTKSELKAVK